MSDLQEKRTCPVARPFDSRNQPSTPRNDGTFRRVREGTVPPLAGPLSLVARAERETRR